ncbi:uncharacterized protein LOC104899291 [Beta vulgaris subsp. vulgaris]|uniref:uncharacterized protein LOC104899291 n=1 Tax=Beta vulgaris subsp. vulgaris TaxID=3555 RepID=UPI002036A1CC|nr:uncharacterized protein LOC104899291 [Beta vulgaris subsp. vulgaris]
MEFAGESAAEQMQGWIHEEFAYIKSKREQGKSDHEEERRIRRELQLHEFDGKDVDDWILLMEDSFNFFQLDEETRLKAAMIALYGEAQWWFEREHRWWPFNEWQQLKKQVKLRFGSSRPTPAKFTIPIVELIPAVEETHEGGPGLMKNSKADGVGLAVIGKCGGENKEKLTTINMEKLPESRGESQRNGASGVSGNIFGGRNTKEGLRVTAGNFRGCGPIPIERGGAGGCGSGGGPGGFTDVKESRSESSIVGSMGGGSGGLMGDQTRGIFERGGAENCSYGARGGQGGSNVGRKIDRGIENLRGTNLQLSSERGQQVMQMDAVGCGSGGGPGKIASEFFKLAAIRRGRSGGGCCQREAAGILLLKGGACEEMLKSLLAGRSHIEFLTALERKAILEAAVRGNLVNSLFISMTWHIIFHVI